MYKLRDLLILALLGWCVIFVMFGVKQVSGVALALMAGFILWGLVVEVYSLIRWSVTCRHDWSYPQITHINSKTTLSERTCMKCGEIESITEVR